MISSLNWTKIQEKENNKFFFVVNAIVQDEEDFGQNDDFYMRRPITFTCGGDEFLDKTILRHFFLL